MTMMDEEPKVRIQIQTETVKAKELMPGDLFSTTNLEYWNSVNKDIKEESGPIGEKVYIRTNTPLKDEEDAEYEVTLVTLSYILVDGGVRLFRSHPSYHIVEIDNPRCPYCNGETEEPAESQRKMIKDTDSGEATDATVNRG